MKELDRTTLSEASTNFDLDELPRFLDRVTGLFDSGFGNPEVTRLMSDVSSMEVNHERDWRYSVDYEGDTVPLELSIFMDDVDSPDVAFFAQKGLADLIQQMMSDFADEGER